MHRAPPNGIWAITCVCALWAGPSMNGPLCGQAGLRESLLQLDSNQDGRISPDENHTPGAALPRADYA